MSSVRFGAGHFGPAHLAGWVPAVPNEPSRFDTRAMSASDLQKMLGEGSITSVQILNEYYRQILSYNGYLKAVYSLAPRALEHARELDEQRAKGNRMSALHGIPVLLKVSSNCSDTLSVSTDFNRHGTHDRTILAPNPAWEWTTQVAILLSLAPCRARTHPSSIGLVF